VDMTIRQFFTTIGLGLLLAVLVLIVHVVQLHRIADTLAELEYQRYMMRCKADELRQSSDDLTRLARTYVVTGEQRFRDDFFQILRIRNGEAPRPRNYSGVYWDLPAPLREQHHPPGPAQALQASLRSLPLSDAERAYLTEAEHQSNALVNLEIRAFKAMEGWFEDRHGHYTIQQAPDQQYAIDLLHGPAYHQAKVRIMLPIDEFMRSIDERTEGLIQETHQRQQRYFFQLFCLAGVTIVLITLIFHATRRKILKPVEDLVEAMVSFHKVSVPPDDLGRDEIGRMAGQFYAMKARMDEDLRAMEQLALSDFLTGVRNRRYFMEVGAQLLALHQRNREPLSLAILDIDFFKTINDTHGHPVGDEILRRLTGTCQQHIRKSDVFARLGGEEFAILCPQLEIQDCYPLMERLRALIDADVYRDPQRQIHYTISIGITQSQPGDSLSALLSRADQALYQAKARGRNQVRTAAPESPSLVS